jgi:peptidoglycan/xylan/chitin deacetylase (PgdA/CDA1 family)
MSLRKVASFVAIASIVMVLPETSAAKLRWIVKRFAAQNPQVLCFVDTRERAVALTIDDGPDSVTTPKILDVLRKHGARATFFIIVSRVSGNEELVKRMIFEGHEIANHLTKDEPSIRLSPERFEQELKQAGEVLRQYSNVRWFRPGSGRFDDCILATLDAHGYRCALGSVYPFDAHIPSSWFARRFVLWAVQPGSIIVLHDAGARGERTAAAVEKILPEVKRRGFRVVTLSELVDLEVMEK